MSIDTSRNNGTNPDPPGSRSAWQRGWALPRRAQSPRRPGTKEINKLRYVRNHPDPIEPSPITSIPMNNTAPRFGFVAFAELWNGRLAMLGFVIGMATELLTGQGILAQVGLR